MVMLNPNDVVGLIAFEASRLAGKLPRGLDKDDLVSVGNEAAVEAMARADKSDPGKFQATLRLTVRNRMKDFLRSARLRPTVGYPVDRDTGAALPLADRRAADPADRAAAREGVAGGPRPLTRPDEVADKVRVLQRAMFGAITATDVTAAMRALADKAGKGDLRAIQMLVQMLAPKASDAPRVTVVVNQDDV